MTIKNEIIAAVKDAYLNKLNNPNVGFLASTLEDILDHLFNRYGLITESMITENKQKINEPFDTSLPFSTFTRRIDQCLQ
mmetsp:Transcript_20381/g.42849  ORF Transcript_20381/g.42849 Transcript_20381/m.42849 type:complete len:80 (+) Transcript_20381:121-360(+)